MKIKNQEIVLEKRLSELDKFLLKCLNQIKPYNYVVVSGYVSILLGRARATEDIDLIIEKMERHEFERLFSKISKDFWCLNTSNPKIAYKLLSEGLSIRFAKKEI